MKSPQEKSRRSARGYRHIPAEEKRAIAMWIVQNQHLPVKQMAFELKLNYKTVYEIIKTYLDVNKQYAFKQPTEPTE